MELRFTLLEIIDELGDDGSFAAAGAAVQTQGRFVSLLQRINIFRYLAVFYGPTWYFGIEMLLKHGSWLLSIPAGS